MQRTRKKIILKGVVQGVGMRFYIQNLARNMDVRGYVKNRADGSVECVGEADEKTMASFVSKVRNAPRGRITDSDVEEVSLSETFHDFQVRF